MRVRADTLILVLEDNGQPFDPTQDTNADVTSVIGGTSHRWTWTAPGEELRRLRVSYEFVEGRNRLTMEHDLTRASG